MEQLNHIPTENESFTYEGLRTVNKMEHRRIKEIIVTKEK
jgi:CBS domain containing-hemolysin-like protein